MVLEQDSQASLTRVTIRLHPIESGLLCNLLEYKLSVGFFGICITT